MEAADRVVGAALGLSISFVDSADAHDVGPDIRPEQTLAVYGDPIRQGKNRYVGLSNHPALQVTRAVWITLTLAKAPTVTGKAVVLAQMSETVWR